MAPKHKKGVGGVIGKKREHFDRSPGGNSIVCHCFACFVAMVQKQSGEMGKEIAHEVTAKNIAQALLEKMLADDYSNVTTENYPEPGQTYYTDRNLGITATITVNIEGDGWVSAAEDFNLTDYNVNREENKWVGSTVFIIEGKGAGQRAYITGNNSTTLSITTDLSRETTSGWEAVPDNTSHYLINRGKTVTISITWTYRGEQRTYTLIGLVPYYG